ncbi:MAG: CubicO group peptidase (beta-lactamase class C family) [Pseudohongiellaceae bacterium]
MKNLLFPVLCSFFLLITLSGFNRVVHAAEESLLTNFELARKTASTLPRLNSFLISHRGELVVEDYFNGWQARRPANMKSASKSVISALIGIAIAEGYIESVDVPIAEFFPDYLSPAFTPEKLDITIEDLLTMQSGLETTSNRNYGKWVLSENWIEFALNQPLVAQPGEAMLYSTGSSHLLSAILTKATGIDSKSFAQQYLASPLGFSMSYWSQDPQGIYFGGNNLEMTAQQMLAFGELYLNNGQAAGNQIIPRQWIESSYQPHAESPRGQGRYYGYGWWLRDLAGLQVPVAWGYGGQLIFVIKELDLVVVATSDSRPSAGRREHLRQLYNMVEQLIAELLESGRSASN